MIVFTIDFPLIRPLDLDVPLKRGNGLRFYWDVNKKDIKL